MNRRITRTNWLLGGVALLAMLVVPIAVAAASDSRGPSATAGSSVSKKKFKKLKKQVQALQQQLDDVAKQPGPQGAQGEQGVQGPQGPAGTAPACQGNGSGDTMVSAGSVCIDRYEVSVWSSPTGGTQYGVGSDNYPCNDNGQDCENIYARSVPGVPPSTRITYFQAQQALANVGKRLPSNAEWQQAVAGTPDSGGNPAPEDCNTSSVGPIVTGSRDNCVSNVGANDMVGNLWEWVADWAPGSTASPGWGTFSNDYMAALSGASTTDEGPGALIRGGSWADGMSGGPLAIIGFHQPSFWSGSVGFRGVR